MSRARESQRFCGREFTGEELSLVQGVVQSCAGISRLELAHTVCELLDWKRAGGGLKARRLAPRSSRRLDLVWARPPGRWLVA